MPIVETHSLIKLFTAAASAVKPSLIEVMMAGVGQQSVCDQELFSDLTESPIAQQSVCDRVLSSELTESPII